jgi:hypothetical protein
MEQGFPESIAAPGIKESWDMLRKRDPREVQTGAFAAYDPQNRTYTVSCLGQRIAVSLDEKRLCSFTEAGKVLLEKYPEYAKLSILRYLIHAQDRPLSGELVKPSQLPGGDFFVSGSHVLPLARIARVFDHRPDVFMRQGQILGGTKTEHGDAALQLFPFPRLQVYLVLWFGDDEFPAWATLLVDKNCLEHMAVDIVWSTCMLTLLMLQAEL